MSKKKKQPEAPKAAPAAAAPAIKIITDNRQARFNYAIEDTMEGGLVLVGTEVKALREGQGQLTDAFGVFRGLEMWLINAHIPEYSHGNQMNHEPKRSRKILLHKREILRLKQRVEREQLALVPLKLYWSKGKIKIELGLGKGKQKHDKRDTMKERDWQRRRQRLLRK